MSQEQAKRLGMSGYGCLGALAVGGLGGGAVLMLWGIFAFLRASAEQVESVGEAQALLGSLEGAVILAGASALAFLVGIVSLVVLIKELSDDVQRSKRGPIR